MKMQMTDDRRAFTLIEGIVIALVVMMLLAFFFPMITQSHRYPRGFDCVNNLKQDGIAFRIWAGDNGGKYPADVAETNGGAQELIATGNVVACFQVMSNELATPKILFCSADPEGQYATNFATMNRSNLSYFIGFNATELNPQSALSGDANVMENGKRVTAGLLKLGNTRLMWSTDRHREGGNVLLGDGSVQSIKEIGLAGVARTFLITNRVVLP